LESSQSDDKTLVVDLCQSELDISPDIITTKRLGKPVPGRAQPLLVTFRQVEQAKRIINLAKSLRRSSNPTIRQHVFINRNLTKAELKQLSSPSTALTCSCMLAHYQHIATSCTA
jgi:hypothetical protein